MSAMDPHDIIYIQQTLLRMWSLLGLCEAEQVEEIRRFFQNQRTNSLEEDAQKDLLCSFISSCKDPS